MSGIHDKIWLIGGIAVFAFMVFGYSTGDNPEYKNGFIAEPIQVLSRVFTR